MSWYSFRVADQAQASKIEQQLQEAFPLLWAAAGTPHDAGIFARYNIEAARPKSSSHRAQPR